MTETTEGEPIPQWLRAPLARIGDEAHIEQLSSRRGVTTFAVAGHLGKALVKLAETTEDGKPANTSSVSREGAVLSSIDLLRERFSPDIIRHDENIALLETWFEGTPAFRNARSLVAAGDETALLALLRSSLSELAVLHRAGWAHGDLQPAHFLTAEIGVVLLDYGTTQSAGLPMDDFKGGMVHFNAPEIAADIIHTGRATATPASDLFALGSVFMFALTGSVIGDYEMRETWEEKLAALAHGRIRIEVLQESLERMPALLDVLLALLTTDAACRPSNAIAALQLLPTDR